jgi:hypothetical protein
MLSKKALRFDNEMRNVTHSGFSHDLVSFLSSSTYFDVSDLESLSLDDVVYLQDLRDQLSIQCEDLFRSSFRRSSGLNFYTDLSESAWLPTTFGEYLGVLDYEMARMIVLVMGDVFRFSLAAGSSLCPFCPVQLHFQHLFMCFICPFRGSFPSWPSVLQAFCVSDWALFVR